jgi:hypothetical protein
MYITGRGDFTDRQKDILEYLDRNDDGKNLVDERLVKNRIIDDLTKRGKGSRMTILRDINTLVEEEVLYVYKVKQNSQTHYVHRSKESLLLSVTTDLRRLKNAFFTLCDESKNAFTRMIEKMDTQRSWGDMSLIARAHTSIWTLFRHFVSICMLNCTVVWPQKIGVRDRKMLDTLYSIVFDTIKEIQIKLPEAIHYEHLEILTGEHIHESFVLKDHKLYDVIRRLEPVELDKCAKELLDVLWKVGLDFVPDALFHNYEYGEELRRKRQKTLKRKTKDWRSQVKWSKKTLPQCEVCRQYITLDVYPWRADGVVVHCDNCYKENMATIVDGRPRRLDTAKDEL